MPESRERGDGVIHLRSRRRPVDPSLFVPAHPVPLLDDVVTQLRAAIVDGRLPPGSRLPDERTLAEQFAVDRRTVREALLTARRAGLLRARADEVGGVFFVVATLSGR
ncbi:winged helix-turn-helix domain-containing protein [Actinomadura sp. LOL_016]|uniref:winged helix-turn-helix domain-containing protein n=1 Tax=unclassified Actinomadura TaxID=2626254 RepID=UPI003A7FBFB9